MTAAQRLCVRLTLLIGLTGCGVSPGPPAAVSTAQPSSAARGTSASSAPAPGRRCRSARGPHADRFIDLDWLDPRRGWALVSGVCGVHSRCTTLYGTRDGGHAWKRVSARGAFGCATGTYVRGVQFVDSRIGYVYGDKSFVTTDGGHAWARVPGPTVESVAVSGRSVFRLVYHGTGCPGPCRPSLERSAAGARDWTTVRRWPAPAGGTGLQLVSGGGNLYVIFYGHIAGGADTAHAGIERSRDGGRTWSGRTDPCGGSGEHEKDARAIAAAGDFLAVLCVWRMHTDDTFTSFSRDAGRTFIAGAPVPVGHAGQIAVGDTGAIAVGNGGIDGGGRGGDGKLHYELALSGDGGRRWRVAVRDREPVVDDPLERVSLQFVGRRNLSWLGYPYLVWRGSDAGHHWWTSAAP